MEENTVINSYFTNLSDKYVVVKDKNGNLIPFNNCWNSKYSIKNNPYYSYLISDIEDTIKQLRINESLTILKNRGLIQNFN